MDEEKLLEVAHKELDRLAVEAEQRGGGTNYTFVFEDGTSQLHVDMGCFGAHVGGFNFRSRVAYFLTNHRVDSTALFKTEPDLVRRYLSWLANESAWSDLWVNKDVEQLVKKGNIFRADAPAALVFQAGVLTRYPFEHHNIVVAWDRFKEFVDPHIALLMAHSYRIDEKNKAIHVNHGIGGNHQSINPSSISQEGVKAMMEKDWSIANKGHKFFEGKNMLDWTNMTWGVTKEVKKAPYSRGSWRDFGSIIKKEWVPQSFVDTLNRIHRPQGSAVEAEHTKEMAAEYQRYMLGEV